MILFGADLAVAANYVDLSGNLGGVSQYGRLKYGRGAYSRNGAFQPIFAGALDIVGQDYFDGTLAPVVTFAGNLSLTKELAGDLAPVVTFAADLGLVIGLAGDMAPQVDFSASLTLDMLFDGGFAFTVTFAATELTSGPLWNSTQPCPPPMWTPTDSDSVEWEKSELCNG